MERAGKSELVGTPVYDNWRAFLEGAPNLGGYEYILHSDARFTGEVTSGLEPYAFINLVPSESRGLVSPAVAVRAWVHVDFDLPKMHRTDPVRYHGGDAADEIAALASLACGVRFRAGNQTRRFDVRDDPLGRPVIWGTRADPILTFGPHGVVLPRVTGEHSLMPLQSLATFPSLTPSQAITVARVARLYQDALWLSESEAGLAWLLLVSAVETAANFWSTSDVSPIDRMTQAKGELVAYLEATAGHEVVLRVAKEFAHALGSTKKFVDFLLAYLPEPPQIRPADWGQIEWTAATLQNSFRKIYAHRSRALHDGMPFPAPMCDAPFQHETWDCVAEKPLGTAMSVAGGTWLAKDTPMHLHTFEYIGRRALMKWWTSMVTAG